MGKLSAILFDLQVSGEVFPYRDARGNLQVNIPSIVSPGPFAASIPSILEAISKTTKQKDPAEKHRRDAGFRVDQMWAWLKDDAYCIRALKSLCRGRLVATVSHS